MKDNKRLLRRYFYYSLLCGLAVLAYLLSVRGNFIYDDILNIVHNQYLRCLHNWQDLLFNADARSSLPELSRRNYRPLFNLVNAVDYYFWGLNPVGYHITNIFLHSLTCILLFRLLEYLVPNPKAAFTATLFFLAHPANVEAVANITGRSSSIAMIFFLICLWAYIHWDRTGSRTAGMVSYACYFLSLLARETSIVLPGIVFLYEIIVSGRKWRTREVWLRLLPFILLSIGYLVLRTSVLGTWAQREYWGGSMMINHLTAVKVLFLYLKMLFFPIRLCVEYHVPLVQHFLDFYFWAGIFSIIYLVYWLNRERNTSPWITIGGAWFFLGLLPVSNLVPLDSLLNDRFLYVSIAGVSLILVHFFDRAARLPAKTRRTITTCVALLLIFMFGLTLKRNNIWNSDIALHQDILEKNPHSPKGYNGVGLWLVSQHREEEGLALFRAGLEVEPSFGPLFYNYVKTLIRLTRYQEAEGLLEKNKIHENNATYHHTYATLLKEMGRYSKALERANRALEINPFMGDYYRTRSEIHEALGNFEAAAMDRGKVFQITK